jgi:hypothetical protein
VGKLQGTTEATTGIDWPFHDDEHPQGMPSLLLPSWHAKLNLLCKVPPCSPLVLGWLTHIQPFFSFVLIGMQKYNPCYG